MCGDDDMIRPRAPEHHVFLADVWGPSRCYSLENLTNLDKKSPNKQLENRLCYLLVVLAYSLTYVKPLTH